MVIIRNIVSLDSKDFISNCKLWLTTVFTESQFFYPRLTIIFVWSFIPESRTVCSEREVSFYDCLAYSVGLYPSVGPYIHRVLTQSPVSLRCQLNAHLFYNRLSTWLPFCLPVLSSGYIHPDYGVALTSYRLIPLTPAL